MLGRFPAEWLSSSRTVLASGNSASSRLSPRNSQPACSSTLSCLASTPPPTCFARRFPAFVRKRTLRTDPCRPARRPIPSVAQRILRIVRICRRGDLGARKTSDVVESRDGVVASVHVVRAVDAFFSDGVAASDTLLQDLGHSIERVVGGRVGKSLVESIVADNTV